MAELDALKEQGSENNFDVFSGQKLPALIFFQTLSNCIIKNSGNVRFLVQSFAKLEVSKGQDSDGRYLGLIRSCLKSGFGIDLSLAENSGLSFSSSEELRRIEIDESERVIFDNGSGFNPRLTRKEELITENEWNELKKGLLQ